MAAKLAVERSEVDRSRALWELRRDQVADLRVRAGMAGVLQQVPLEEGQRVTAGANLARVGDPTVLKAELRIAETQAKDVQIGQLASVDTRNGVIAGRVVRIDPAVENGTVTVEVTLEEELPRGARPRPDGGRDHRAGAIGRRGLRGEAGVRAGGEHGQPVPSRRGRGRRGADARPARAGVGEHDRGPRGARSRRPGGAVGHVGLGRVRPCPARLTGVAGTARTGLRAAAARA